MNKFKIKSTLILVLFIVSSFHIFSQSEAIKWSNDGNSYYKIQSDGIVQYTLPANNYKILFSKEQLTPAGSNMPLQVSYFNISDDET